MTITSTDARIDNIKILVRPEIFEPVLTRFPEQFRTFPAAVKHHHAEIGGYARHIHEVLKAAILLYEVISKETKLDFGIGSLTKVAFLHDLDKLERYEVDKEPPTAPQVKFAKSLGIEVTAQDSKSSVSTKIDNKKNNKTTPIRYFVYKKGHNSADESARVMRICMDLGITLTDYEMSAICCHHGGWSAAGSKEMSQMATILHSADLMSAKILGV